MIFCMFMRIFCYCHLGFCVVGLFDFFVRVLPLLQQWYQFSGNREYVAFVMTGYRRCVVQELRERVLRGKYRIPFYMSTDCENILKKFLVLNPVKRATLEVWLHLC